VSSETSDHVRAARVDLAAAHRLAVRDGMSEGTWSHLTLIHPEEPERMLMTPPYWHWSQVTASSLVDCGPEFDENGAADISYRIHYPVHAARPDAACVLHVHSPALTSFSLLEEPLPRMVDQNALYFMDRIAVTEEFDGLEDANQDQGKVMVEALGDRATILILRNHGVVVTGSSVANAYVELYLLERTCAAQLRAMATGLPLNELTDEQLQRFQAHHKVDMENNGLSDWTPYFEGMKRVVDVAEPDYRN
jgi:ribulose-5-phosphate 4-epimerase/fuculose-1-phosphate aldolase